MSAADVGPEAADPHGDREETRCGYVAIVGRPNAGKSTLLNAVLDLPLSIVSSKPQTTWRRITGILTRDGVQAVFLDTPGLLSPSDLLQTSLLHEAEEAIREADVILLLLDPLRPLAPAERDSLADRLRESAPPLFVAVNKSDRAEAVELEREVEWARGVFPRAHVTTVSALSGQGVDELLGALVERLPTGPFLYPEDEIATDPVRFFVAELVRETVFEQYRDEIPYSTVCRTEEFREGGRRTYIQVNLYVERPSQKGILIGEKGAAIRELGKAAREKIERFLGEPVYLDLWVKVLPSWRRRKRDLRRLGFRVPEDHERTASQR